MKLKNNGIENASIKVALNIFRAQSLLKRKMNESKFIAELRDERGDVPGWVLVTVMTAGLVVAVWSVADGQLKSVLTSALRSVSQP